MQHRLYPLTFVIILLRFKAIIKYIIRIAINLFNSSNRCRYQKCLDIQGSKYKSTQKIQTPTKRRLYYFTSKILKNALKLILLVQRDVLAHFSQYCYIAFDPL